MPTSGTVIVFLFSLTQTWHFALVCQTLYILCMSTCYTVLHSVLCRRSPTHVLDVVVCVHAWHLHWCASHCVSCVYMYVYLLHGPPLCAIYVDCPLFVCYMYMYVDGPLPVCCVCTVDGSLTQRHVRSMLMPAVEDLAAGLSVVYSCKLSLSYVVEVLSRIADHSQISVHSYTLSFSVSSNIIYECTCAWLLYPLRVCLLCGLCVGTLHSEGKVVDILDKKSGALILVDGE